MAATVDDYIAQLQALFPADSEGIAGFFAQIAAVYREMYADIDETGGVPAPPATFGSLITWPAKHPHAWRWMRQPFSTLLDTYLKDRLLKDILTTLSEYITETPALLSVGDMAPLFGYYFVGGYYPIGGSQNLPNLLTAIIEENGGRVHLKRRVTRILLEGGHACGIETSDGVRQAAPLVIANGDVQSMLLELVGTASLPPAYLAKVKAMKRGPTAVVLSLATDICPDLPARVFVRHGDLGFGIGNPCVIDPGLAPPGHGALTVLCLLPEEAAAAWTRKTEGYPGRKADVAERLITAMEATVWPDIRRHILFCQVASPATFSRYAGTRHGNIYGAARGQWCPGVKSPVPGLLLAGAGTSTGAGIEAVVVSGTIAADMVVACAG